MGSLGRGNADEWSDVDLYVLADTTPLSAVETEVLERLSPVALTVHAPQNTRLGAHYFAAAFVVEGILLHTDWYVFPAEGGAWPSDARPVIRPDCAPSSTRTFDEINGEGERGAPIAFSEAERWSNRLAMVPLAAKGLVRGSPGTADFVAHLTGTSAGDGPGALDALSSLISDLQGNALSALPPETFEAIRHNLALARDAIEAGLARRAPKSPDSAARPTSAAPHIK